MKFQLQDGFSKINENCEIFINAKGFLRIGMDDALAIIDDHNTDDADIKCKSSLVIAYTGLELLLKSLLQASANINDKEYILASNLKFKFTSEGVKFEAKGEKTIYRAELLERLKDLEYDLSLNFNNKLSNVAEIRNEIIHKHTDKPFVMILNAILDIFEIVNIIIGNNENTKFWGNSLWDKLCKEEATKKRLEEQCEASYQLNNFKPNKYFKCLGGCQSNLIKIINNQDNVSFICKRCNKSITKDFLINELINSPNFAYSHQVVSFLIAYLADKFSQQDKEQILSAREDNGQVGFLYNAGDDDIIEFYDNRFFQI